MWSFLKSLFRKRWLRSIALSVGVICAFYFGREWWAEHQWQKYAAASRARGVPISVEDFGAAKMPDDEDNFAGLPMWKDPPLGPARFPVVPVAKYNPRMRRHTPGPPIMDFAGLRQAFVDGGLLTADAAASGTDVEVVLHGLAVMDPYFAQLLKGASRPQSRFAVDWSAGPGGPEPAYTKIMALSRFLDLKVCAELAAGHSDVALAHWQAGWSLARAGDAERKLISNLIHVSVSSLLVWQVWQGLDAGAWQDDQLLALERRLNEENLLAVYHAAFSGERTFMNGDLEKMMAKRDLGPIAAWGSPSKLESALLWSYCHQGSWWRNNQLWLNQLIDEQLSSLDPIGERWTPLAPPQFDPAALRTDWRGLELYLAREYGGGFTHLAERMVMAHVYCRFAALGCALERYRHATGQYPEKLSELVPKFLATLPHEPITGASFQYRRDPAAGYLLYSTGLDGQDDGGKVAKDKTQHDLEADSPDWRWWAPGSAKLPPGGDAPLPEKKKGARSKAGGDL